MLSKHLSRTFRKRDTAIVGVPILLTLLWVASLGLDRLWLAIDHSVPSWDPADHLIGALNYGWMVRNAGWFSADWWQGIWTLSSKYPPLLYLSTAPFINLLGPQADTAIWVNGIYTAILLGAVYALGRRLFSSAVGLWAAGLCVLFPQFYTLRSHYFMDYPLTALVAAAFCLLTCWRGSRQEKTDGFWPWLWAIAFGIIFGFACLMKQTAVLFLGIPLLVLGVRLLWQRQWGRVAQLVVGSAIAGVMMLPWSRTNWLFQISAAFSANTRSAEIEGDPSALTLAGWTYYISHLPSAVSYPLLVVAVGGLALLAFGVFSRPKFHKEEQDDECDSRTISCWHDLLWLMVFVGGTYGVWSAIANKDVRYIMPYLPVIAVIMGLGMASWRGGWRVVPWAAVGLSVVLMVANLFSPVGQPPSAIAKRLTPAGQQPVYLGDPWPHAEIIAEMVKTQPHQIMNLGVLPSTPEINQHNLNYFGTQADFQVYARRMGKSQEHIDQDLRSLSWFVSVTRPQLNHHDRKSRRRQLAIARDLRRSPDFKRQRQWDLPDGSRLNLFQRKRLPVEVIPWDGLPDTPGIPTDGAGGPVQLAKLTVPDRAVAGDAIPVTYGWQGTWDALSHCTVLLKWERSPDNSAPFLPDRPSTQKLASASSSQQWLHDHSIGFGTLRPQPIQANQSVTAPAPLAPPSFATVVEHTAMQPPAAIKPGTYRLTAAYLDPMTGEATPLAVPPASITLTSREIAPASTRDEDNAPHSISPDIDWVSQLRLLATALPEGIDALGPVFDQIGRFSLYDPIQSYAIQAEITLRHRLRQDPTNLHNAYALTLAQILQRNAEGAIATLTRITDLDADNPYAHAYLAFVHLYALHPYAAQSAIERAIVLAPDVQEFRTLRTVALGMGGNVWRAWRE